MLSRSPALPSVSLEAVEFLVVRSAGGWQVHRDGRPAGQFSYKIDAVEAALRSAVKARRLGRVAQVLEQDGSGRRRVVHEVHARS